MSQRLEKQPQLPQPRPFLSRKLMATIGAHSFLIVCSIICAIPFLWLMSTSLKHDSQIFVMPPIWWPNPIVWSNYSRALEYAPILRYMGNSVYLAIMNIIGTVVSCTLVAYGFARFRWPGRDFCFVVLLSTMMLPPQVTMIPLFLIFREFGWLNTFTPLYIQAFFGTPLFHLLDPAVYVDNPGLDGGGRSH